MIIESGSMKMHISEHGGYVTKITLGDYDIIKPGVMEAKTHGGIAPLFPYANRIRKGSYSFMGKNYNFPLNREGNSIHGFAKDQDWEIIQRENDLAVLSTTLDNDGFPFNLECMLTFKVKETGYSIRAKFTGHADVTPLAPGFHPYFCTGPDWKVHFSSMPKKVMKSDRYFPSGSYMEYYRNVRPRKVGTFDDCFMVEGPVSIEGEKYKYDMETTGVKFIMLYNGEYAENSYVAVEPMSSAIDSFNSGEGLVVLKKGEVFETGFSVNASKI